jgi:hypothetical protein
LKKTKKDKPKRSHKKKIQVSGYYRNGTYVKPYKRTKPTKRRLAILAKARELDKQLNNPLRPGWVRHKFLEPEERVTYTYKVEILVRADYKYHMQFAPRESMPKSSVALQYWHSKFEPTIKKATVDFLGKVPEIRAYGDVQFISIDLYRVSGVGKMKDKHWKLIASFDEPEDVGSAS